MYGKQNKKAVLLNILEILKKYTDQNHRLSQREIGELLEKEYDVKPDRKTIKNNLMSLIDCGYDIEYSESIRKSKNGEEKVVYTDWYFQREFDNCELRLLIDALLFADNIPKNQLKSLLEKLEGLSNQYFNRSVRHICNLKDNAQANNELFYNIEILDDAIQHRRKVSFYYCEYAMDKKLHRKCREDGTPREYIINPYQIAVKNGQYYLICNLDQYDTIANYRLDRIVGIKVLDQKAKPEHQVKGCENNFELAKHIKEHIYMFGGDSENVTFNCPQSMLSDVIDWFGVEARIEQEPLVENQIRVHVRVNYEAMVNWCMQYGQYVQVLKPERLRNRMIEAVRLMEKQYGL
jgi:predicted DNA-binding transcriptional regulator YafY